MRIPFRFYKSGPNDFLVKFVADLMDRATILETMRTFYRRFFAAQFKRNAAPDGPKVGSVSLSQRGDWRMPADATGRLWLEAVERLT